MKQIFQLQIISKNFRQISEYKNKSILIREIIKFRELKKFFSSFFLEKLLLIFRQCFMDKIIAFQNKIDNFHKI
jgi:hypothetical protein